MGLTVKKFSDRLTASVNRTSTTMSYRVHMTLLTIAIMLWTHQVHGYSVDGWFDKAVQAEQRGQLEEAIALYTKVLEIEPESEAVFNNRGVLYARTRNHGKAIEDFSRALQLNPVNVSALHNRAMAYEQVNEDEKALADYNKALAIDPKHVPTLYNRAALHFRLRDLDRAQTDLEAVVHAEHRNENASVLLAKVMVAKGDTKSAIRIFTKILRRGRNKVNALEGRGDAYFVSGQYRKAERDYSAALRAESRRPQTFANRCASRLRLGTVKAAALDCEKAVALTPESAGALFNYGLALAALKKHSEASDAFSAAIKVDSKQSAYYYNRGIAHRNLGDHDQALEDFSRALAGNQTDADALNNRGIALSALGRKEEAIADFRSALNLHPDHAAAGKNLAALLIIRGNADQAVPILKRVLKNHPRDGGAVAALGDAAAKMEQWDEAVKLYLRAIRMSKENSKKAALYTRIGTVWERSGKPSKALRSYKKALRYARGNELEDAIRNRMERIKAAGK